MMSSSANPSYRYLFSPHDLMTMQEIVDREWSAIAWADPEPRGDLTVRCSALRVAAGDIQVTIGVRSQDIDDGFEVFRLTATRPGEWASPEWYRPPPFVDSDERLSAFVGKSRRLFIAGRTHTFESKGKTTSCVVEDLLVLRHHSGQHALVCADVELPGSLLVTRDRSALPSPGMDFDYLRAL
jgi:hypothetical protein